MTWFDTAHLADGLHFFPLGRGPVQVRIDGTAVRELEPGWFARGAYAGVPGFIILDLATDVGRSSFWILDTEGNLLGSDVKPPPAPSADAFHNGLRTHLKEIAHALITDELAPGSKAVRSFYRLQVSTREMILTLAGARSFANGVEIVDLVRDAAEGWTLVSPVGNSIGVSYDRLMRTLHVFLNERLIDGFKTKCLRWPFLTKAGLNENVHCLFVDSRLGLLRCIDGETGIVYYVVIWGAQLQSVAVYVPASNVLFGYSTGGPGVFLGVLRADPVDFEAKLAQLFLCSGAAFLKWLQVPAIEFAGFMWPGSDAHLGHYLWNETSGLEVIVRELEKSDLPRIFALGAPGGYEFYGPVEDLYPELNGKFIKSFSNVKAMEEYCYVHGIQALRVSGQFVSQDVRNRIMRAVKSDPDVAILRQMVETNLPAANPVIVLGLRLTDRTHAQLREFYCALIDNLLKHCPNLVVVIDGVNSRPGQVRGASYDVFSGARLNRGLIDMEAQIVQDIRAYFIDRPVTVVDCVGTSMRTNLFWIDRSNMFVAPWGAGLVKYRWVCNKPGFVMTNRSNLLNPIALPIYHLPGHMENPTAMEFIDPAIVYDIRRPDEVLDEHLRDAALSAGGLSATNFTVDAAAAISRITSLFLGSLAAVQTG